PAAVAGRLHAHEPGIEAILHVADEDAVFDKRGRRGGRSLIIDAERAAPVGEGAVIDDGDALGGDPLAHQAREGARLLAVEIALKPMADGLVQQNARPARAQDHIHLAGGGGLCFERDDALAHRFAHRVLPATFIDIDGIRAAAADTVGAMPAGLAVVAHDAAIEPDQRAGIAIGRARCPYDLDVLAFAGDRQAHLLDAWIERA